MTCACLEDNVRGCDVVKATADGACVAWSWPGTAEHAGPSLLLGALFVVSLDPLLPFATFTKRVGNPTCLFSGAAISFSPEVLCFGVNSPR